MSEVSHVGHRICLATIQGHEHTFILSLKHTHPLHEEVGAVFLTCSLYYFGCHFSLANCANNRALNTFLFSLKNTKQKFLASAGAESMRSHQVTVHVSCCRFIYIWKAKCWWWWKNNKHQSIISIFNGLRGEINTTVRIEKHESQEKNRSYSSFVQMQLSFVHS